MFQIIIRVTSLTRILIAEASLISCSGGTRTELHNMRSKLFATCPFEKKKKIVCYLLILYFIPMVKFRGNATIIFYVTKLVLVEIETDMALGRMNFQMKHTLWIASKLLVIFGLILGLEIFKSEPFSAMCYPKITLVRWLKFEIYFSYVKIRDQQISNPFKQPTQHTFSESPNSPRESFHVFFTGIVWEPIT